MDRDLRRPLIRELSEVSKRVLVRSLSSLAALIGGAVISNERDRTYLLLGIAPFLGIFLLSLALKLAARFSPPDLDKQAPFLPESVLNATRSRFNEPTGTCGGEDERVKPIGSIGRDECASSGKKPCG